MGDVAGATGPEGDSVAAFAGRIRDCAPDLAFDSLRLNPDGLGILISTYGESFVLRMAATYPLDAAALNRARFRTGEIDLQWALAGVRSKDPAWFLVHLGRARDVGPYSRL